MAGKKGGSKKIGAITTPYKSPAACGSMGKK